MEEVRKIIASEVKKKAAAGSKISMNSIAQEIGYKNSDGLYAAIRRGTLSIPRFIKIAELLDLEPADLLPSGNEQKLLKMPLLDLIKTICKKEIKNYIKDK